MAKKSKFAFNFEEMDSLVDKLNNAGGSMQEAADAALKATHAYITPNLESGINRHIQSGDTKRSLDDDGGVKWVNPIKARVDVGFNIKKGGLPSVFLMWGTPKMRPDSRLKNAAFGAKTKREVAAIQREEMEKAIQKALRG